MLVFEELIRRITECVQRKDTQQGTWLGHRVFIADGTGISPGQTRSKQIQLLGKKDQIVQSFKTKKSPWMSKEQYQELPGSITVRDVQYCVTQKGFRISTITVVTTLLHSKKYTAKKIAALYFSRWSIETNINYLKTTMNMEILRTKSPLATI